MALTPGHEQEVPLAGLCVESGEVLEVPTWSTNDGVGVDRPKPGLQSAPSVGVRVVGHAVAGSASLIYLRTGPEPRRFSCMQVLSPTLNEYRSPRQRTRNAVGWGYSAVIGCLHVLRHTYYPRH